MAAGGHSLDLAEADDAQGALLQEFSRESTLPRDVSDGRDAIAKALGDAGAHGECDDFAKQLRLDKDAQLDYANEPVDKTCWASSPGVMSESSRWQWALTRPGRTMVLSSLVTRASE